MQDERRARIGREIFLVALGLPLETIDEWVLDRMTSVLDEHEIRAGQVLFRAGDASDFLFFMRDGRVRFSRDGGPSWTLQGRWVIGGYEALGERIATHTAVALDDSHAMRVPTVAWLELLEDSFQLARSAVVNASRSLLRLEERVPVDAPMSTHEARLLATVPRGPLGLVERLALLLDVRMLRLAGVQVLADLAATSELVSFEPGDPVLGEALGRDQLVCLIEGDVLAERDEGAMVRRYGTGDVVCAAATLGRVAEGWRATATSRARGITFPVEALFDLMEEHFDLVRATFAALATRRALLLEYMASRADDLVLS